MAAWEGFVALQILAALLETNPDLGQGVSAWWMALAVRAVATIFIGPFYYRADRH